MLHALSTYASTDDYENITDEPPPAELTRATLVTASRRIDRALFGAIYDLGDDGHPTDCDIREALRVATVYQAEKMCEDGDTGNGAVRGTVRIGSVQVSNNPAAAASQPSGIDVAPKALDILTAAGLLPIDPMVRG